MRIIAIDWSGASDGSSNTWLAEIDSATSQVVRLENGRSRDALANHLIAELGRSRDIVVGIDFAFALPAWFSRARGFADAPALWNLVANEGESWLSGCEPPFWGRPGKKRPEIEEHFRRADLEVPAVGGIRPKSVFQIGGAGAVGTGSLRGMPLLERLRNAGFNVWPFDPSEMPMVVEIYPRALTGAVNKGDKDARRAFLEECYPKIESTFLNDAVDSEDAFDALVSALVMVENADDFRSLEPARDDVDRLEGRIWLPKAPRVRVLRPRENRQRRQENGDGVSRGSADVDPVPTISAFYGIVIYMYADDHAPPHFHAVYGEHQAVVEIESGRIIHGSLPRTAAKLVTQWAEENRGSLMENWTLCASMKPPKRIPPLT